MRSYSSMIEIYLGAVSVSLNPQRESRADFISVAFGVRPSKLQQQQASSRGLKRNCHRHRAGGGEKGSGWW